MPSRSASNDLVVRFPKIWHLKWRKVPLTLLDVNALTEPKLDIVYCVSLEEDSTDGYDEFDILISENKLILPVTKLLPSTSPDDTVDLQGGNGRIFVPQLIVERKSCSGGFFNCQSQLFG